MAGELKKLVIFGAGQTAEVAHFYFSNDSAYDVAGFTVDAEYITEESLYGLPVVPFEEVEETSTRSARKS